MNSIDEVLEFIQDENPEAAYPTDLKEAIIGIVRRKGMPSQILIDQSKCVEILMTRDGMDEEEAIEFLEFNTYDAFIGNEATPCFATLIEKE